MEIRGTSPRINVVDFGARAVSGFDSAPFVTLAKKYRDDNGGVLYFPPGSFEFGSNVVLNGALEFADGGRIKPRAGTTVTVSGTFTAEDVQLFDCSLGGTISFAGTARTDIRATWWGNVADPSALAAALSAAQSAGLPVYTAALTSANGYADAKFNALNDLSSMTAAVDADVVSSTLLRIFTGGLSRALRLDRLAGAIFMLFGIYVVTAPKFGAKGDGVTNDAPAIQAAIDAVSVTGANLRGATVWLPPGKYYCATSIRIRRPIVFQGAGGAYVGAATTLQFADGVTGLVIDLGNTSSDGGGGAWCVLRDMYLIAKGKTIPGADGVLAYARFMAYNVSCLGFSQHGWHLRGGTGLAPNGTATNCNQFYQQGGRNTGNGGCGWFAEGSDVNNGKVVSVECTANGQWGFWDNSFLGNDFDTCQATSNVSGPYYLATNNSSHVLLDCYSEAGQPPSKIIAPNIVVGGQHGAGFTADTTAGLFMGYINGGFAVNNGLIVNNGTVARTLGSAGTSTVVEDISYSALTAFGAGLIWRWRWDFGAVGLLSLYHTASGNPIALALTDGRSTLAPAGSLLLPNGYYRNGGGQYRRVGAVNGGIVPALTDKAGDVYHNVAPTQQKCITAWVCIVAGNGTTTNGIWNAIGAGLGTTAQRPVLTSNEAGFRYFDTTIGREIMWDGTAWAAPLTGSAVYDPPSLATGTQQSTTITVTGAVLGQYAKVAFSRALAGTRMWAEVSAADTVTVYHRNDTGAAVDLASGTLTVSVTKS